MSSTLPLNSLPPVLCWSLTMGPSSGRVTRPHEHTHSMATQVHGYAGTGVHGYMSTSIAGVHWYRGKGVQEHTRITGALVQGYITWVHEQAYNCILDQHVVLMQVSQLLEILVCMYVRY